MDVTEQIKAHALEEYPRECVGYVVEDAYHRLENISEDPNRYQLSLDDRFMLFEMGDKLKALVHSHPVLDNSPSECDLGAQKVSGFPFWIIGTDGQTTTDIREVIHETTNH